MALFLILFSNHMEERLEDGKAVLRVDCHMTDIQRQWEDEEDFVYVKDAETTSLLGSTKICSVQLTSALN